MDRQQIVRNAAARGKYAPLYRRLLTVSGPEWAATFREIEGILGFRLPDSARRRRSWWANPGPGGGHGHALAWRAAGWLASAVDLEAQTLAFVRAEPEREPPPRSGGLAGEAPETPELRDDPVPWDPGPMPPADDAGADGGELLARGAGRGYIGADIGAPPPGHAHYREEDAMEWISEPGTDAHKAMRGNGRVRARPSIDAIRERAALDAAARSKYAPLYRHLLLAPGAVWQTGFREIEGILGFRLPNSARLHRSWWSNPRAGAGHHGHAVAWRAAGWRARAVNLEAETVEFERLARRPEPETPRAPEAATPEQDPWLDGHWPARSLGLWPLGFTVSREQIYDDEGRLTGGPDDGFGGGR